MRRKRDDLKATIPTGASSLQEEISAGNRELDKLQQQIMKYTHDISKDKSSFEDQQNEMTNKQKDIAGLTRDIEELGMKNIANQQNADRARDLAETLNELRKERDNLSSTVESLQLNPFMTDKRTGGSSIAVQVDRVRGELMREESDAK